MTASPPPALEVRGLRKAFGSLVAVDGLDLVVPRGICLGLLGPNGAGKTTTVEILEGLGQADAGELEILGLSWTRDAREIRRRIGVQLQETRFADKLTVFELLRMFRSFYDRGPDPARVMEQVGLTEKRDARSVTLSGGQRQRLALGCALVNDPELLFLDEPTTGLDPQARRKVWEVVEGLKRDGRTVILTTHYMEEAEILADDVVILDHGKIISQGSPRQIIDSLGTAGIVEVTLDDGEVAAEEFQGLAGVSTARRDGPQFTLETDEPTRAVESLLAHARERGLVITDLRTHRPTLEDVFVSLTGRHLRDG